MVAQLKVNDNGTLQADTRTLQEGDNLTVLVYDGIDNKTKWIDTTVYFTDNEYGLSGIWGYSLNGLFVKVE